MYALAIDSALNTRVLGGPFTDIDEVLDVCFEELMATDGPPGSVFYAEKSEGGVFVREFPRGAFPFDSRVTGE